jgi:hypothetical protein
MKNTKQYQIAASDFAGTKKPCAALEIKAGP